MYREYSPHPCLAPYIDKYWEMKGGVSIGERIKILPDGCTDFIFNLDDVGNLKDKNQYMIGAMEGYFVGPMNTYSELLICAESIHVIGVRFSPGGWSLFSGESLEGLMGKRVSVRDFNVLFYESFGCLLREKNTLEERLQAIESFLFSRLQLGSKLDQRMLDVVALIQCSGGVLPVKELINKVCICQRHLERCFKQATGYTLKEYSRIVRFQQTVKLLRQSPVAGIFNAAVDCGYYDSSHLLKEFKKLSGGSPQLFTSFPIEIPLTYLTFI